MECIWPSSTRFISQKYLVQAKFESHEFCTLISSVFLIFYYSFHAFLSESCHRGRGAQVRVINPEQRTKWAFLGWKAMSTAWKPRCLLTIVFGKGLGWVSRQVSHETAGEKISSRSSCFLLELFQCRYTFTSCFRLSQQSLSTRPLMFHIVCWLGLNKPVSDISSTAHYWWKGNNFVSAGSVRHMTPREMIFLPGLQEAEGQKWVSDNGICSTIFMWALCSQIHLDGSESSVTISTCQVWIALEELEPSQVKASVKLIEIMHDMDMTSFWGRIN